MKPSRKEAVENWIKSDQPGIQIASELASLESFKANYKRECVGLAEARGVTPLALKRRVTFRLVEKYYNRERLCSALGFQSPVDFEQQLN